MAKNERAIGHTKRITGLATGAKGGELLHASGWAGIVVKDIVGTSEPLVEFGREISGAFGDGAGDIQVEGVFKLVDESGGALADGGSVDRASPSGVKVAADPARPDTGHVFGDPYMEDGVAFVDVKLLGRPK